LRIKIPVLKRNPSQGSRLQSLLKGIQGIECASVNAVTGSLVIHFDPEVVSSRSIVSLLSHEGYIDLAKAISSQQYVQSGVLKFGQAVSKALLGFALDRAFQGTPLSVLTAFI
jgi:hypothetical protein